MEYAVTTTVRLLDGRISRSLTMVMEEEQVDEVMEFARNAAMGHASYMSVTTNSGKVFIPKELLKTAIICVEALPVDPPQEEE
jgi:hypothetical protein